MTIVEFLEARLAEDEAAAQAASKTPWLGHVADNLDRSSLWEGVRNDFAHIGRHDPARVLREVAAKRAILAYRDEWGDDEMAYRVMQPTLRVLASVYADHPDYDLSWAVA